MAEVTNKKRALYEILEIAPDASYSEIQAAYQRVAQKLQSEMNATNRDEIDHKLKMLGVAYQALAYDAKLVGQIAPANIATPRQAVPAQHNYEAVSLKADAVSFKADAMSFKADAMSLKADALSLKMGDAPQIIAKVPLKFPVSVDEDYHLPMAVMTSTVVSSVSALKKILRIVAGLMVLGVVIKVSAISLSSRQPVPSATVAPEVAPEIAEKIFIQDYYQKHGVRVKSKAEAELLDAENGLKQKQEIGAEEAERRKQIQDQEDHRFAEESRREGERISEQLRRDEQAARYEEQRKEQQLAQEKREQEQIEYLRREEDRRQVQEARRKLGLD